MNILMYHNGCGSKLFRIYFPAKYIRRDTEHEVQIRNPNEGCQYSDLMWADVVVLEMVSDFGALQLYQKRKAEKKPVAFIFEVDDLMHQISENNPAARGWSKDSKLAFETTMRFCDAITVTTEHLKDYYSVFNKNIYVLPNSLDFGLFGQNVIPNQSNTIRLGWAGGISHRDDLKMVVPVIKKILDKYDNVKFVHCGFGGRGQNDPFDSYTLGDDIFEEIPINRREMAVASTPENWPRRLGTLSFDIGIAPVTNDPWNWAKSNLKFLEYASLKIPTVASGGEGLTKIPYSYTIKDGEDGYLANSEDEWFNKISKLIEDKKLRKTMGQKAYNKTFNEYNIATNWKLWSDCYKEVFKKVV